VPYPGNDEGEPGQAGGDEQRLQMDLPRLAPELAQQPGVADGLRTGGRLAQPARGEADSGVRARLRDGQRGEPEGDEEEKPEAAGSAEEQETGQRGEADDAEEHAEREAPAHAGAVDVSGDDHHRATL
jgi:hypothetical protein